MSARWPPVVGRPGPGVVLAVTDGLGLAVLLADGLGLVDELIDGLGLALGLVEELTDGLALGLVEELTEGLALGLVEELTDGLGLVVELTEGPGVGVLDGPYPYPRVPSGWATAARRGSVPASTVEAVATTAPVIPQTSRPAMDARRRAWL